ncbi:MAG: bifunctional folylpolyglutamate synthase/dihydrofolate synthase [Candidatus Omnitrophica bacterium]|nr:bifunctional folylpolyglutamate synthase/dihydrofolate synthase [Candidatus Omnitrophota bacterium]
MQYRKALRYLNSFLNLEQVPKPHSRIWNLKRMRNLLEIFHHPEKGLFAVVIAGTKGKGSTGYFLSEILRSSGLRVGFYHSPHIESPNERIWIGAHPVSKGDFAKGLWKIRRRLREVETKAFTYFEIMTLLAALLFKEKKVDVAIFEAGMGGRLDATHVFPAKLAILTPIHFDHEAFLGNTLAEIAHEKAAILQPYRDVVVAPEPREALQEIKKTAKKRHCPIWRPLYLRGIHTGLLGDFQKINAGAAIRAAVILRDRYQLPVTREAIFKGTESNRWPGRMEIFKGRPTILLDVAHNPQSIRALSRNLKRLFPKKRKIIIFGTSGDKRSDRMIPYLASLSNICILTHSDSLRSKEVATLLAEAKGKFPVLIPMNSSKEALAYAKKLARPEDMIVITGSFYLVGELRPLCQS